MHIPVIEKEKLKNKERKRRLTSQNRSHRCRRWPLIHNGNVTPNLKATITYVFVADINLQIIIPIRVINGPSYARIIKIEKIDFCIFLNNWCCKMLKIKKNGDKITKILRTYVYYNIQNTYSTSIFMFYQLPCSHINSI